MSGGERTDKLEQLLAFLEEYVNFFEQVEKKQNEKLEALLGGKLARIEEMIVMQQAMDKQIENMEEQRLQLFKELGAEHMTFRELIDRTTQEQRALYTELYGRLDKALENIRFINGKCMKVAQSALAGMGTAAPAPVKAGKLGGYVKNSQNTGTGSVWNTKI